MVGRKPLKVVGGGRELFEMASLDPSQTGIEGTIYMSTQQAGHAPRVKYYAGRPGNNRPSMSVTIAAKPQIVENSLPARVATQMGPKVQAWVTMNHRKLRKFWFKGNTWYQREVDAFVAGLKKYSA